MTDQQKPENLKSEEEHLLPLLNVLQSWELRHEEVYEPKAKGDYRAAPWLTGNVGHVPGEDQTDRQRRIYNAVWKAVFRDIVLRIRYRQVVPALEELRQACLGSVRVLLKRRPNLRVSNRQIRTIAVSVATYVAEHHDPSKQRAAPKTSRGERLERDAKILKGVMALPVDRRPSARALASEHGMSKSSAQRLLASAGIAPRQFSGKASLSELAFRLDALCTQIMPKDGRFWTNSWLASRALAFNGAHSQLERAAEEINLANVGLNLAIDDGRLFVGRGRRLSRNWQIACAAGSERESYRNLYHVMCRFTEPEYRDLHAVLQFYFNPGDVRVLGQFVSATFHGHDNTQIYRTLEFATRAIDRDGMDLRLKDSARRRPGLAEELERLSYYVKSFDMVESDTSGHRFLRAWNFAWGYEVNVRAGHKVGRSIARVEEIFSSVDPTLDPGDLMDQWSFTPLS